MVHDQRTQRAVAIAAMAIVLGATAGAGAQDARSPAQRLGSPAGAPERAVPDAAATPVPERPAAPDLDAATIPEPPGSHRAAEHEVRYPVPSPQAAARASAEPAIRIPSRVVTRMRALDANLQALGARGGGNVVNAVLSLITGGLAIMLGALKEPNTDAISIYLYVYGGTAAVRGVLEFVLTPNAQGAAITYQHMPMTSVDEVRERLAYGESALGGIAEQSLIARVLDGSLNMAAGVAVVPIYLAQNGFGTSNPLEYFVLIGAGVSIITGIITLVSTSPAEQRWSAYQELRERLREERLEELRDGEHAGASEDHDDLALLLPPPRTDLRFDIAPSPLGAFAGLSLAF